MTMPMPDPDAARMAALKALPFVRDPTPQEEANGQKGRIFWTCPEPSGDWQADCAQGEAWARLLLDYMAEYRTFCLLGWVVRDMRHEQKMSGQAVGFLSIFAQLSRFAYMLAAGKGEALLTEAKDVKGDAA